MRVNKGYNVYVLSCLTGMPIFKHQTFSTHEEADAYQKAIHDMQTNLELDFDLYTAISPFIWENENE